jgi:phospholipase A1/A2
MRYIWPLILFVLAATTRAESYTATEAFTSQAILTEDAMNTCLQASVVSAAEGMTIRQLKEACQLLHEQQRSEEPQGGIKEGSPAIAQADETPLLKKRMTLEALNRSNRFMLTPHKRNYFFPVSYTRHPNTVPYRNTDSGSLSSLSKTEAEFQLSVKILIREDIFGDNGHLYLGYTNHSLWQVYNDTDSAPFRATDHQPEFILSFTNDWEILGFQNRINEFSLTHQSNGLGGLLSRSWNRIMLNSVFERGNFAFGISPWYRIPEPEQEFPGDPHGDDNPDIEDYMGHVEFNAAYQHKENIFNAMMRNNFDGDNKGAIEVGWSFPVSTNLRGQFKYFKGYGHSLIDYNTDMEIFALGIVFTDLF